MIMSQLGASAPRRLRTDSRSRRLTRLRSTAPPTRLLTEKPTRVGISAVVSSSPFRGSWRAYVNESSAPLIWRPRRRTRSKSRGERSRWLRRKRPCPGIRSPTTSCFTRASLSAFSRTCSDTRTAAVWPPDVPGHLARRSTHLRCTNCTIYRRSLDVKSAVSTQNAPRGIGEDHPADFQHETHSTRYGDTPRRRSDASAL